MKLGGEGKQGAIVGNYRKKKKQKQKKEIKKIPSRCEGLGTIVRFRIASSSAICRILRPIEMRHMPV